VPLFRRRPDARCRCCRRRALCGGILGSGSGVAHEPLVGEISLGKTIDEALDFATEIGPAGSALRDATDAQRAAASASIREELASHATAAGVRMAYAAWIVTAER
jgi:hypothetical protein